MLTVEEIRAKLEDRHIKKVAQKSGVHYNVIYRLMSGQSNPSYETLKKLTEYLEQH